MNVHIASLVLKLDSQQNEIKQKHQPTVDKARAHAGLRRFKTFNLMYCILFAHFFSFCHVFPNYTPEF